MAKFSHRHPFQANWLSVSVSAILKILRVIGLITPILYAKFHTVECGSVMAAI
jgi:hypothetical protein